MSVEFSYFLASGLALGFSAGFAPGPLLTLVMAETLQHDMRAGVKVAIAPFVTDLPIILFSLFVLTKIHNSNIILGCISLCGGIFIAKMGVGHYFVKKHSLENVSASSNSLFKGIMTNLLSPHPYLFWLSVGAPIMSKALRTDYSMVVVFLATFYFLLVGSKVFLAVIVGRSKQFLHSNIYLVLMRFLGIMLMLLALFLFKDGVHLLLQ